MRKVLSNNLFRGFMLLAVVTAICILAYFNKNKESNVVSYTEFINHLEGGEVEGVKLSQSDTISFTLKDRDTSFVTENPRKESFKEELLLKGVAVSEGSGKTIDFVFSLALFGTVLFAAVKISGKPKTMALEGQKGIDVDSVNCGFSSVAGNEEAKMSVGDVVSFLNNPEKYTKYGARMPRGIIFYGPPGTGKTLMAKAIAGEAGVPFYAVSGSDFVQMYVGVGAGRIRDLFKKAREDKKAVIFIDEIDALGKKRALSAVSGNEERDQTLNALLTEMSGFSSTEGIVVIAATNRLDILDEALLRPGRFDRQIEISLPDVNAREKIIRQHSLNKPLEKSVDLKGLARSTVCFSGAMLENLLNEAAIFSANRNGGSITADDLDKAYYTVIAGSEKKDRSIYKEKDRKITAYHESGHALAARLCLPENTVSKVTIIPSTKGAGGFCVNVGPERMYHTKKEIIGQVIVSYAGRAAEELIFGEENITTGGTNDIEKATEMIKNMVTKYGMGKGMINAEILEKDVVAECSELADSFYKKTVALLKENIDKLHCIAEKLLEKETLNEDELINLLM